MERLKTFLLFSVFFIQNLSVYSQIIGKVHILKGYFIVSCFDTSIKNGCDLNIKTIKSITGDSRTCGDGNFYKNISSIKYVKTEDLDLNQIDNFKYNVSIQKDKQYIFLTTNPQILLEANEGDSAILDSSELVRSILENQTTAELIQKQINKLKLDFKKKRHYYVLLDVSIKVIDLPKRIIPVTYRDNSGFDQFIILFDKKNKIKKVKIIKDPF